MPSMSDDFQLPIMYQDLRDPNMGMLPNVGMYPGMGMYPQGYCTNYLGGMKMAREMNSDTLVIQSKKKKSLSAFTKVMIAVGSVVGLAYLNKKGLFKWIGTQLKSGKTWVENLFGKKVPQAPPVPPAPQAPPAPPAQ